MKIELHSTSQITRINGVECRVWEGRTARGTRITAFVARVAVDEGGDARELERELRAQPQPRPVNPWPARMVVPDDN
jgi:hypothetical protein